MAVEAPAAVVEEGTGLNEAELKEFNGGFDQAAKSDTPPTGAGLEPRAGETPASPANNAPETPAAAPAPAAAPKPDTPAKEPDYKAMYEKETAARKTLEGKYNAEVPRLHERVKELETKAAPAAPAADPAKPAGDPGAEDEDIVAFREEMPTSAIAVEKMIAKAVDARVKSALDTEVRPALEKVDATVKPLAERGQQDAINAHFNAIRGAHKDFDQIVGSNEFGSWMDGLPSWQRDAAKAVYENGSAQQVIDLVVAYKTAAGIAADTPQPKRGGSDTDAETVDSRRQPLAPRSGAPAGEAKDDFGSGFALATGKT